MNLFVLFLLGTLIALLLIYWYSRKNESFGDGIALLCLLISRPLIVVHDKLKEHFPEPTQVLDEKVGQDDAQKSGKKETMHRKVNEIVGDVIGALVGS